MSSFIPPCLYEKWGWLIPVENLQGKMAINLQELAFYFTSSVIICLALVKFKRAWWNFSAVHNKVTSLHKTKLLLGFRLVLNLCNDTVSSVQVACCWIWEWSSKEHHVPLWLGSAVSCAAGPEFKSTRILAVLWIFIALYLISFLKMRRPWSQSKQTHDVC